jgi:predicted transcriptional regulator
MRAKSLSGTAVKQYVSSYRIPKPDQLRLIREEIGSEKICEEQVF